MSTAKFKFVRDNLKASKTAGKPQVKMTSRYEDNIVRLNKNEKVPVSISPDDMSMRLMELVFQFVTDVEALRNGKPTSISPPRTDEGDEAEFFTQKEVAEMVNQSPQLINFWRITYGWHAIKGDKGVWLLCASTVKDLLSGMHPTEVCKGKVTS